MSKLALKIWLIRSKFTALFQLWGTPASYHNLTLRLKFLYIVTLNRRENVEMLFCVFSMFKSQSFQWRRKGILNQELRAAFSDLNPKKFSFWYHFACNSSFNILLSYDWFCIKESYVSCPYDYLQFMRDVIHFCSLEFLWTESFPSSCYDQSFPSATVCMFRLQHWINKFM